MNLLGTVLDFTESDRDADRAVFEAAMLKRIKEGGLKMSDIIYEIYVCQREIQNLKKCCQ
jgi:hypothetical protein